jgi:hypothetical protein
MQRGERQSIREGSQMKVSDLREQFRTTSKPAKPVKAAKHVKNAQVRNSPDAERHKPKGRGQREEQPDRREELMAKAEKLSQIHHTTSLLTKNPKSNRLKPHKEKKNPGLLFQLLLVMLVAAGVTVALDPTILPAEIRNLDWQGMQYEFDAWLQDVTG